MAPLEATPSVGASAERIPTDWDRYVHHPRGLTANLVFFQPMARAYERLLGYASFSQPISLLELGCGTGTMSLKIAQQVPTRRVALVDSNNAMLDIARRTFDESGLPAEVKLLNTDVMSQPGQEQYDLVHSGGLIEHFSDADRQRLLQIHAQHTKPGGYCIIFVPIPSRSYRLVRSVRENLGVWMYTDEVPLPAAQVAREVEAAGLTVIATTYFWNWYLTEVGIIARAV